VRPAPRDAALLLGLLAAVACHPSDRRIVPLPPETPVADRRDDPPVAVNAETPVEYPPALFEQGIEGNVVLRLHTDEAGTVVAESTKVAESSGYPALDSAALRAAPQLKFAPALRNGTPVAATFLQPIHFRHPQRAGTTP
jgi:protein TonB